MRLTRVLCATLLSAILCSPALCQELTSSRESRNEITIYLNGKETAVYHSGPALDKGYFHPLRTPDGRTITYDAPADHLHHRALCVGWPDVSNTDFWAEVNSPAGRRGRMVPTRLESESIPGGGIRILEENVWVREDGSVLVRDRRTWTFLPPEGNLQLVDLDLVIEAVAPEVVFGSDPEKPREYHGLTLRAGPFHSEKYFNSNGNEGREGCKGDPAKWCAISGTQSGRPVLAAILDHPQNDSHPTKYYIQDRGMQFISSSPNYGKPKVLKKGDTWHLRYRVVAAGQPAEGGTWDLDALWEDYAEQSK